MKIPIFFLATLLACATFKSDDKSSLDIAADGFIVKVGKQLCKQYQMKLAGIGGAEDQGMIKNFYLGFQYLGEPVSVSQGRKLMVTFLDKVYQQVQIDEKIRPFIKTYPFGLENIKISIYTHTSDCDDYFDPYLAYVSFDGYDICYAMKSPLDQYKYRDECETYEEAVTILKAEKASKEEQNLSDTKNN